MKRARATIAASILVAMLFVPAAAEAAVVSVGAVEGHVQAWNAFEMTTTQEDFATTGAGADAFDVEITPQFSHISSNLSYGFHEDPPGPFADFHIDTLLQASEGQHGAGSAITVHFAVSEAAPFVFEVSGFASDYQVSLNDDLLAWTSWSGDPRDEIITDGNIPFDGLRATGTLEPGEHVLAFHMFQLSHAHADNAATGSARLTLVPEPASAALLGAAGLALLRRRRSIQPCSDSRPDGGRGG